MQAIGILKYGKMKCSGDIIKWTDKKTKEVITFIKRPHANATPLQFQETIIKHLEQLYKVNDNSPNKKTVTNSRKIIKQWLKFHLHDIPSSVIYKEILNLCTRYGFSRNEIDKNNSLFVGKQWIQFFKDNKIRL